MKKVIITIFILAIIIFAGVLITKRFTGNAINSDVKEFTVKAFRFGYSPDIITVNKGDKVKILIKNVDVPHGIQISALGVRGIDSVEFTAETSGEYIWNCYIPCGPGHKEMRGKLIIK